MPNGLNDPSALYGSLGEESSMEALMRIDSYLNNSLDLRSLTSDATHKSPMELLRGGEGNLEWPDDIMPTSMAVQGGGGCLEHSGLPLSRLLSQGFNYSSDSSSSPHTPITPRISSQVGGRGSVFSYMDDSPQSSGSGSLGQSLGFTQSPSSSVARRLRISTTSDPGSPTLEDAIMMGCHHSAPLTEAATTKMTDASLASLVSSLSLSGGSGGSVTGSPVCGDSFPHTNSLPSASFLSSARSPATALLGLQQQEVNTSQHQCSVSCGAPASTSQLSVEGNSLAQLHSSWLTSQLLPNLVDHPTSLLSDHKSSPPLPSIFSNSPDPFSIEKAAKLHRNAAAVCDATCTWSGQLPTRLHKNPVYSCKVFLGGVPWDVTETALKQTFLHYGNIQVEWPGKESSANPPKGYVYIIFEYEKQVKALLAACSQDFSIGGNYYYKISSRRIRQKEVQIIPWVVSDSNYVRCPSYQLDPAKTVFVGALHGMLSAEGLANIMNDLFGGVVYSGIDTDKNKYPIGSGRVTFNNVQSYRKAVRAAFIGIKTPKFTKKVQIDPYLADSLCQLCGMQQGPYFCRHENCFKYFCRSCWQLTHPIDAYGGHKPIMRNSKLRTQTTLARVI